MALSFIIFSIKQSSKQKTAYQTHFLSSKALQQQQSDAVVVPPSRGSSFSRQRLGPRTPSDRSTHTGASERLPPIHQPSNHNNNTINSRKRPTNGDLQSRQSFIFSNKRSSPSSPKRYITKSMSTTTTVKKPISGGPVKISNGTPTRADQQNFNSDSLKRRRRFWWSPQRNSVEIRTEDNRYQHVGAKIGSLDNIEYRPSGGNVSIRDEPPQWTASSKIDSLANANWSPPPPRVSVRTEKLNWDAQPKIGSLEFIDHKPAGGNVAIRDEKLDLSYVTPRVDCGFID